MGFTGFPPCSTIGTGIEFAICIGLLVGYAKYTVLVPSLFAGISREIYSVADNSLLEQMAGSFSMIQAEGDSEVKWMSLTWVKQTVVSATSTVLSGLALALFFVMSLYQGVLFAVWFFLGPILIPFFLYRPFRNVGWRWLSSLFAYSFMGVVGAVMYVLMAKTQFALASVGAGTAGDYITSLVYSVLIILMMIQIPGISTAIWDGVSSSMAQAIMVGSTVGGAALSTGIAGAGGAGKAAGLGLRGGAGIGGMINRYSQTGDKGMSTVQRLRDSFINRAATTGVLSRMETLGKTLSTKSGEVLMSQMPASIRRADAALKKTAPGSGAQTGGRTQTQKGTPLQMPLAAQHKAMRDFAIKYIGPEKARNLVIPGDWKAIQRPGQTEDKAIQGAAKTLMQKQGFIDKKGESKIAGRSKYSDKKLGRKKKEGEGPGGGDT